MLDELENELITILCKLEMYFTLHFLILWCIW